MITIKNLYKTYLSAGGIEYPALRGLSLHIGEGEMLAIMGTSGAGKSTLLHIIAGIEGYDSGEVLMDGKELRFLKERELSAYRNRDIGIVLQDFALISDCSVYENIILPLHFTNKHYSRAQKRRMAEEALAKVDMAAYIDKSVDELSGGQRQRVAIARAILNHPRYILADEPTGALDSANTALVVSIMKQLHLAGTGVIIVTHDKDVAAACPRHVVIEDGRVVSDVCAAASKTFE